MNTHYNIETPKFNPAPENLTFLSSEDGSYTYGNLFGFASWLSSQTGHPELSGPRPLLIVSESSTETVFLIAAAYLLKIPVIPVHHEATEAELENIAKSLQPVAVYTYRRFQSERLRNLKKIKPTDEVLQQKETWNPELFSLSDPEKKAGIFFTSGSTGSPKIVPIKRKQVLFAAHSSAQNFKPGHNKYWLLCLPLNHVGGINVIYRSLLYQSAIFLVQTFDEEKIRQYLYENKAFEVASMVPTMLENLMKDSIFRVHFGFKAILLGGGPMTIKFIDRALTRGLPIVTSYGMTETCAQIAANPMLQPSGEYIPKTSVGRLFHPNKVEIRDEKGEKVITNESGHIWLKGPQVFDGYNDEELNKKTFDESGWFNTGDFGHLNRKGHLFIDSRRTDLIITGGENVAPVEVESVMNTYEGIAESSVVGIPDKKWGQKMVAFVVPNHDHLNRDEILEFLKKNLKAFQVPKEFIMIDEIPKTDTGKIRRRELAELYLDKMKQ